MKKLLTGALCGALLLCAAPSHADAPGGSTPATTNPAATNPAPEKFGAAVTFYASYDHGAAADLSNGEAAPRDKKLVIETKPGLWGNAFLSGATAITYDAAGNMDLSKPGAIALWISPYEWKREEGKDAGYIFFAKVMDQGRQVMLARMGNPLNKEAVYAYGQASEKGQSVRGGDSRQWKNGEWHLLVANWSNTALEFSLDGGTLNRQNVPGFETTEGKPGQLFVGSKSGEAAQFLVDELMILNRPLAQDEIQAMWESKPTKLQ